jgi:hypothetical protein
MMVLDEYPLQELQKINLGDPTNGVPENAPQTLKPVTAERTVRAKYRVLEASDNRISFTPVQKQHLLDSGAITELVDIHINLNETLRSEFGKMQPGDEKEFTLNVTVLEGYEKLPG